MRVEINVRMCWYACESACEHVTNYLFCFSSFCVCAYVNQRACCGSYFEVFDILGGHFKVFDSQRHFPSSSSCLLSVLALGSTVILRVYSCLDLGPGNRKTVTCVGLVNCFSFSSVRMAVIDWWDGSFAVIIFFASCLLLLTWSITGTVKSLFSAVLNLAQSSFLPPLVQAWLELISASLFLAPGLCICWVFSVFF